MTVQTRPSMLRRFGPLALLILAAGLAYAALGDRLGFEALQSGHEALQSYRAAHPVLTGLLLVLAYTGIVALSLPGATIATLTGGFLFGIWPGTALNVAGATLGAIGIFLAVRAGFGRGIAARLEAS
ncbi:MAG: TVP38/TMEM64 family protein, partial [Pseudomonadota bacterium]|nr:TVP38/TMEM64 family protein [Pseudomonadota bacterium]